MLSIIKMRRIWCVLVLTQYVTVAFDLGCDDGTYGQNCSEMCGNCLNNSVCDPVNGSCPSGCDKGFMGLRCIEIDYINLAIQHGCTSYSWNISMDLALLQQKFPNITESDVFLGGSSCKGVINGTLLEFEYDFTQCHTSKQKHDDFFVYNNRLVYAKFDEDNAMIIRQHIWEYEVECDLVTSGQSSSHIHHGVHHDHAITVQNNINLAFYSDANFADQIKGNPVEVHTGDNVYVKVFTTIADWSMKLRLHSCFTRQTSSGAATNYFLIKDGCEVDKYTHIMSQSTHETTFMFQDFEYSSDLEGLDVFCNATLCDTSDFTPRCMQSCNRLFQRPNVVG
ncbi:CUB and zona pellucida-like domain-containing protein 1 isoform X2 [Mya arenaria]|uniref:CUB and zona pellucida-like domain-containing protein 1 isoform X2 n=1 Tax=Mya arenaria TaxID=6604 RepID=UPI0022DF294D|nr:CUB and zona pellucida-like domain-containing protein 1 isoform X2 [Mya arenaria]